MLDTLPVAKQAQDFGLEIGDNLVLEAETGAGKSLYTPPFEQKIRGGKILLRQPTRVVCESIARAINKFWPDTTVGVKTRDTSAADDEALANCDIIVFSDGSLSGLLSRFSDVSAIYFDELHVMPSPSSEIDLAIAKGSGLPIRAMTATIDPVPVCDYLGARHVLVKGRTFPLTKSTVVAPEDVASRTEPWSRQGIIRDAVDELCDIGCGGMFFMPTRAMCEEAHEYASSLGIASNYCHGGVSPGELFDWHDTVKDQPWILFSTTAAATGVTMDCDRVWILDDLIGSHERNGVTTTYSQPLDDNTLLQCAGRTSRTRPGVAYLVVPYGGKRRVGGPGKWFSAQEGYVGTEVAPRPIIPPCSETTPHTVIVQMAAAGIHADDIDLLSHIPNKELRESRDWLMGRGILDHSGELTRLGKRIAAFPASPPYAHLILTAPSKESQMALAAAVQLNPYSMVRIRPGLQAADKKAMTPGWTILPRDCIVRGSTHLTLAKILATFSRQRDRNAWCEANNLVPAPLWRALRDFEHAAGHIGELSTFADIDFDALYDEMWHHLKWHPLFRNYAMREDKALPTRIFRPMDSVMADAFDVKSIWRDYECIGIPRTQLMKNGRAFYPIEAPMFAPEVVR